MIHTFHQAKPCPFLFQSSGKKKVVEFIIVKQGGASYDQIQHMKIPNLAVKGMMGNLWLISLKINLDVFIFR